MFLTKQSGGALRRFDSNVHSESNTGRFYSEYKRPGREADHSPSPSP